MQLRGHYILWSVRKKPPVFSLQELSDTFICATKNRGNILDSQQFRSFVYFAKNVSCFSERVVTSRVLQVEVWPVEETRQRADDTQG